MSPGRCCKLMIVGRKEEITAVSFAPEDRCRQMDAVQGPQGRCEGVFRPFEDCVRHRDETGLADNLDESPAAFHELIVGEVGTKPHPVDRSEAFQPEETARYPSMDLGPLREGV